MDCAKHEVYKLKNTFTTEFDMIPLWQAGTKRRQLVITLIPGSTVADLLWQKGQKCLPAERSVLPTKINRKKCKRHCYVGWMKLHYDDFGGRPSTWTRTDGKRASYQPENGVTLCRWKLGEVTLEINVPSPFRTALFSSFSTFLPFSSVSSAVNFLTKSWNRCFTQIFHE